MMEDFYRSMNKMGPAPSLAAIPEPLVDAPESCCRCACGKKFMALEDVKYHNTGILVASDTECRECLPSHKNFALVICLKCKAVVAKMAPKKFDGGFELKSNGCYHVASCPSCCKTIKVSHLIEKYMHDKAQGLAVASVEDVMGKLTEEKEKI
jgi:hypothetical protein